MADPGARLSAALADRYTLERELGQGGMATVYLAHDSKHDRNVAIKVLRPELAAVLGAERFVQEIKTTANLQHPNILPLFDSGEADGFLYYVMPYVEGETLRAKLNRETQLGVEEAVKLATEVADALDYAHHQNVIHRDIKPENILLHAGRPLVADFGIALAVSAAAGGRMTETGLSLGTPHYMSPEQATADKHVTHRSDIYSLGAVLYEMLTGDPPHTGSSAQAIILKIVGEEVVPVTRLRKAVPPNVASAVAKALEKLPADRFAHANELADALRDERFTIVASDTIRGGQTRRRSTVQLAVLSSLVALSSLLAIWGWTRPSPEPRVQHLPLLLVDPPRVHSMWSSTVAMDPSGDRVAYRSDDGWQLLDLRSGTTRSLGFAGLGITFSPGGDSIARTTSAFLQQIHVIELATGRSTALADSVHAQLAWGPDGWIYHGGPLGLGRVRVQDGVREILVPPEPGLPWHVASPRPISNGRAVLYAKVPLGPRRPALSEIILLNLETRRSEVLGSGVEARVTPSGHLLVAQVDGTLLAGRFNERSLQLASQLIPVLDGLEIRQTWELGASFMVGDDGSLLYVRAGPLPEDTVVIIGRHGEATRVIAGWSGDIAQLAYSDRGARWAATLHPGRTTPNVFARTGDSGNLRRITFTDEILDYYPQFVPNSADLVFVSPRIRESRNWDLYRVPFDGSRSPSLVLDRPGDIHFPRFTSDGQWVVFCEGDRLGGRDVVAHRLQPDSATTMLVESDANECFPDVSPDGRWLAYTSDASGQPEVYVRRFGDDGDAQWQVSRGGGNTPRFSPNGTELFYVSSQNQLMTARIRPGPSFAFESPRVLFELDQRSTWTREMASDDEFIVLRERREATGQVVLIRNFDELLRQKVGG